MKIKYTRKEELLVGFVTGTLSEEEHKELITFFPSNRELEQQSATYKCLINDIEALPSIQVPQSLESRLLSNVEKNEQINLVKIFTLLTLSLTGIFAINFTGRTFKLAQTNSRNIQNIHLSNNIQNRTFQLKPFNILTNQSKIMNASLLIRPEASTNILKVQGLPSLSPGLTYRLWAYTHKGPQGCVSFFPDQDGNVYIKVPSQPTGNAIDVSITVDKIVPGLGPDQPGNTILTSI